MRLFKQLLIWGLLLLFSSEGSAKSSSHSPYLPKLLKGDEASCRPILSAFQSAFKSSQVKPFSSANLSNIESGFSEKVEWQRIEEPLYSQGVSRRFNFNADGAEKVMVRFERSVSWYAYIYFVKIYNKAALDKAISEVDGKWIKQNGKLVAPHKKYKEKWRLNPSTYLMVDGKIYLAKYEEGPRRVGQGYDRENSLVVFSQIGNDGGLRNECVVEAFSEIKSTHFAKKYPSLNEFIQALHTIGGEGQCDRFQWRASYLNRDASLKGLLFTPYQDINRVSKDKLNRFEEYEQNLRGWSKSNWGTQRAYHSYETLKDKALSELRSYYQSIYGFLEAKAKELSERNLKNLIIAFVGDYALSAHSMSGDHYRSGFPKKMGKYEGIDSLFEVINDEYAIEKLIETGTPVDAPNPFMKTPLMYAAHYDLPKVVAVLLSHKANVNAKTIRNSGCRQGWNVRIADRTALMYAAENASQPVFNMLVRFGADTDAIDSHKRTIQDYIQLNKKTIELAVPQALGPSFDCSKAQRDIEYAICFSDAASIADYKMSKKFTELSRVIDPETKPYLKASQRKWLKSRNSTCSISKDGSRISNIMSAGQCLADQAEERVRQLETQAF